MLLFGLFMILLGIGFIWQPLLVWPYLIAIFLILLGIGFVIRGIRKEETSLVFFTISCRDWIIRTTGG